MKRPCFPRVFSCFAKGALLMRHAPVILIASLYSLLAPPWRHVAISFAGSTTGRGAPADLFRQLGDELRFSDR